MAFQRKVYNGVTRIISELRQFAQNVAVPSGAILYFNRTTAPTGWVVCDGTNGTPNLIGRYPRGSSSDIGKEVAAGLPDITGTFVGHNVTPTGAFYKAEGSYWHGNRNNNGDKSKIYFAASESNSIYGNSDTVTPPSTNLLPCMKL